MFNLDNIRERKIVFDSHQQEKRENEIDPKPLLCEFHGILMIIIVKKLVCEK